MDQPIRKSSKKMLDAMRAIGNKKSKLVVMEVVGPGGITVDEYRDDGKEKPLPYYRLEESYVI